MTWSVLLALFIISLGDYKVASGTSLALGKLYFYLNSANWNCVLEVQSAVCFWFKQTHYFLSRVQEWRSFDVMFDYEGMHIKCILWSYIVLLQVAKDSETNHHLKINTVTWKLFKYPVEINWVELHSSQ